jgi:two-component system response regulator VicR
MAKIMIVDDNIDIADTLRIIMEKEGNQTMLACNGEDFLSKVDDFRPDLVLLDVMMPGLTTEKIMEKLKEKGWASLKVILVTVVRFSDEEKKLLYTVLNITDYITKPFDVFQLIAKVNKHLGKAPAPPSP